LKQLLVLLDIQVVCARQVPSACQFEGKLCVVQSGKDIRYYSLLIDVDAEDLSLLVDTDDTVGRLVLRSYKDSLAGNTVHVYASARFEIIKVNETVFRYEVDDAMLLRYLHSHWEVVRCFGWEVDIHGFLDEWRIRSGVVDFNNM
jgi:hypothetical protein